MARALEGRTRLSSSPLWAETEKDWKLTARGIIAGGAAALRSAWNSAGSEQMLPREGSPRPVPLAGGKSPTAVTCVRISHDARAGRL